MTNATDTESQTTFKGTSFLFTRCHTRDNGIAPSLEKAYPILQCMRACVRLHRDISELKNKAR